MSTQTPEQRELGIAILEQLAERAGPARRAIFERRIAQFKGSAPPAAITPTSPRSSTPSTPAPPPRPPAPTFEQRYQAACAAGPRARAQFMRDNRAEIRAYLRAVQ